VQGENAPERGFRASGPGADGRAPEDEARLPRVPTRGLGGERAHALLIVGVTLAVALGISLLALLVMR